MTPPDPVRQYFEGWFSRLLRHGRLGAETAEPDRRTRKFVDHWFNRQTAELQAASPHREEWQAFENFLTDPNPREPAAALPSDPYPERAAAWHFWLTNPEFSEAQRLAARTLVEQEWGTALTAKESRFETRELARQLPALTETLVTRSKKLRESEKVMESIFGRRDWGWDLEEGDWQDTDLGPLLKYAEELTREPAIQRIADLLGKDYRAKNRQPDPPPALPPPTGPQIPEVGKVEIRGITQGGEFLDALTSELALLAHPETETVFLKKWAEGELLTLHYQAPAPPPRFRKQLQDQAQDKNERGPIIIAIDTSGSMRGKPEEVAKLAVLAVVQIALAEGRRCYLINFSAQIKTLEVSDHQHHLKDLLQFLAFSFHGGTDLPPALRAATSLLKTGQYRDADVLILSDFAVPKIPGEIRQQIRRQQEDSGTRFYCLTISARPLNDFLNIFDAGWVYNINQNQKPGIAPESLNPLS